MQNLQIKYEESSAQLQYLQQYSLVEEEEIHRHTLDNFEEHCEEFQFKEGIAEDSSSCEALSYEQFVQNMTKIKSFKLSSTHGKLIKKLLVIILGDVFEHIYYHSHYGQIKPLQLWIKSKWVLILHILLVFCTLIFCPFQFLAIFLLLIGFVVSKSEDNQSEIEKSANCKSIFNNLMNKLKHVFLHKDESSRWAIKKLNYNIGHFAKQLQIKYNYSQNDTPFAIDQINQSFHHIHQHQKHNNYARLFLTSKSFLMRKYFFWRLKIQNQTLKHIQQTFEAILEQFEKQQYHEQPKYMKPIQDKNIFFLILLKHFQDLYEKNLANASILKILNEQIEFKRITNVHLQKKQTQILEKHDNNQINLDEVPLFSRQFKAETDSYYYVNDTLVKYESEDIDTIKQKLNVLFTMKQEKQAKITQVQQKPIQKTSQKYQKSIFCFGIPIIPPKRDLSAYYIE